MANAPKYYVSPKTASRVHEDQPLEDKTVYYTTKSLRKQSYQVTTVDQLKQQVSASSPHYTERYRS